MTKLLLRSIASKSFLVLAVLLPLSTMANAAEPILLDRIVAIVDDDIVLESELAERIQLIARNIEAASEELPSPTQLRKEVLDLLIVESLQLQMAERAGLRINDQQLASALERIAAQNNMDLEQFRGYLDQQGGGYQQAREQIRREMILQQVQQGNVNQRIQITEQEIRSFLSSKEGQALTSPEYNIAHLLIEVPAGSLEDVKTAALAKARRVASRIRSGEDLKTVAAAEGVSGSDLGWRRQRDLPSLFLDVVPPMEDGEVSEPFSSPSGYHIVKLNRTKGRRQFVAQTKVSHILLKPSAIRTDDETERLAKQLRLRILGGEPFRELAKNFSEDIGSAQEGGQLGWTNPGQLVPEFQEAMDATPKERISEPVKSRYGWHIIKVENRRKEDVTETRKQTIARNELHQRKFNDELDIWLRKIRDEAYIDIK